VFLVLPTNREDHFRDSPRPSRPWRAAVRGTQVAVADNLLRNSKQHRGQGPLLVVRIDSRGRLSDTIAELRGPIAQRLEQRTHNPLVLGSNPSGPITTEDTRRRSDRWKPCHAFLRNAFFFTFSRSPLGSIDETLSSMDFGPVTMC
jgi:hypothetical protein